MTKMEKSYGVILVLCKEGSEDRFLVLRQNNNTKSWSFPKGHSEENETAEETAKRELREEAGITDITFIETAPIFEEYDFEEDGIVRHKINQFFIGFANNEYVAIQPEEIIEYRWATFNEAMKIFVHTEPKKALRQAIKILATK